MENIFGLTAEEIAARLSPFNLPPYRAKQIAEWIYKKQAADFSAMTNLPNNLRQDLCEQFCVSRAKVMRELTAKDHSTQKFLLYFDEETSAETVLMRHDYGNSVCVSTQAGCNMGCRFCASAANGLTRNLTAGEIIDQVLFCDERLNRQNAKVDTIVVMGMGEPLNNYDNVLKFIRLLHEPYVLNMGFRNITLSTSGIVPNIYRLARENIPVNLAVSLHAPFDDLRSRLMPINRRYSLKEVVAAGKFYGEHTGRRVTYEYILIDGVNDSHEAATALAKLLAGQLASINLIPVNFVEEYGYKPPSEKKIAAFIKTVQRGGITATIRRSLGADVNAACGQLRKTIIEEERQ